MKYSKDVFISTLAQNLSGNQVDSHTLTESLHLINEFGAFDVSMIYEIDSLENFCLKEHTCLTSYKPREKFTMQEVSEKDIVYIKENEFCYIRSSDENSSFEKRLLEKFSAASLFLAHATDENQDIHGFIVFVHEKPIELIKEKYETMITASSLLLRCLDVRIYQRMINQAHITMESILDNTGIDIYVNDFYNHDILYVNRSMAAPYGGREQFMGKKCWQVLFPGQSGPCEFCPQKNIVDENGSPTKVYTWDYQRAFDGSWFRVFSSAFRWVDGRLAHVVSSADITDNKHNEALIENLANYDQLTKLPNRRMLLKECERRIDLATLNEKGYILFFDIDNFKTINDTLGHDAGDDFLIQLGEFFSSIPLLKDSIYRNGGDEFVAVLGGEEIQKSNIIILANFILERFRKPWKLRKGNVFCNISIGVACFPEDGTNAEILIQKADMAMYKIKKAGGGGLCFGYELNES